jgi:dTDP-glucose 4,6-dehydratase
LRILITGGAGFIGSHLCDRFLAEGYSVIAVDNLITGDLRNLEHLKDHPGFQFIEHDISLPLKVEGPLEAVLHFASLASPPHYLRYPIETLKVGSYGTHNTLDLALEKQARYLLASTSEIYGDPLEHPQRETYLGNVDAIGVRGVYDEGKRYAEALTMAYHRKFSLRTYIVRIFNTYGPRMTLIDGRVVPNFITQAINKLPLTVYGNGGQTRSFQYVDDLVDGLMKLLFSDFHQPVNIGNPLEMTILEFANTINQFTGNTAGIIFQEEQRIAGDPQTRCPDIRLAKEMLGWEPNISLEEGIRRTVEYFVKLREKA